MSREAVNIKLILASGSPRRKDILEQMGLDFKIIPSCCEEILENLDFTYEKIEKLAYDKAFCVAKLIKEETLVIGVDTVVVLDNQILGKPSGVEEASEMLNKLSAQTHFVVTSICIINSKTGIEKISSTTSYVEFENLTPKMIKNYVLNYKPYDKAGAYGIQELPEGFVKNITGSFENIIGLCPLSLEKILKDFNYVITR